MKIAGCLWKPVGCVLWFIVSIAFCVGLAWFMPLLHYGVLQILVGIPACFVGMLLSFGIVGAILDVDPPSPPSDWGGGGSGHFGGHGH